MHEILPNSPVDGDVTATAAATTTTTTVGRQPVSALAPR